jgi:hypothetical protein
MENGRPPDPRGPWYKELSVVRLAMESSISYLESLYRTPQIDHVPSRLRLFSFGLPFGADRAPEHVLIYATSGEQ